MEFPLEINGDDLKYPEWQEPVRQALLELNKEKLKAQVAAAEAAIAHRLQALSQSSNHQPERWAIEDAKAILRVLKRDILGPG